MVYVKHYTDVQIFLKSKKQKYIKYIFLQSLLKMEQRTPLYTHATVQFVHTCAWNYYWCAFAKARQPSSMIFTISERKQAAKRQQGCGLPKRVWREKLPDTYKHSYSCFLFASVNKAKFQHTTQLACIHVHLCTLSAFFILLSIFLLLLDVARVGTGLQTSYSSGHLCGQTDKQYDQHIHHQNS